MDLILTLSSSLRRSVHWVFFVSKRRFQAPRRHEVLEKGFKPTWAGPCSTTLLISRRPAVDRYMFYLCIM
jgi:hypothetical protein